MLVLLVSISVAGVDPEIVKSVGTLVSLNCKQEALLLKLKNMCHCSW